MDKKTLYDAMEQLEQDMAQMMKKVTTCKTVIEEIVEENAKLHIENEHLRNRLNELEDRTGIKEQNDSTVEAEMTKSRMNLEKLYEDGFHVCNMFYGSRRIEDEPCAFCIDVIYGDRTR